MKTMILALMLTLTATLAAAPTLASEPVTAKVEATDYGPALAHEAVKWWQVLKPKQ
jgi:hypothetical protein